MVLPALMILFANDFSQSLLINKEYTERFWCLNVYKKNDSSNYRTILKDCRTDKTEWLFASDGSIRLSNGKCLEVKGVSEIGGPSLRARSCDGSSAQQFIVEGDRDMLTIT